MAEYRVEVSVEGGVFEDADEYLIAQAETIGRAMAQYAEITVAVGDDTGQIYQRRFRKKD